MVPQGKTLRTDGAVQCAGAHDLAIDAMRFDEIEHQLRRVAKDIEQALAVDGAEDAGQVIRHDPHAGIHQPDISAGGAEADFDCFQQGGVRSAPGQMQGGGQAGVTAADDGDIRPEIPSQRVRRRSRRGRDLPKPMGSRIILASPLNLK
jgi:hypothetical protein